MQQTVIHKWPDGQIWMPCPGGMVICKPDGTPTTEGVPLDEYDPPDGAEWQVVELPDSEEEGYWAVWRLTKDGEVAEVAAFEEEEEARACAEHNNAGPDGPTVGSRFAEYVVVRR